MEGTMNTEEQQMDTLEEPKAFVLPTPTQVPVILASVDMGYKPRTLLSTDSLSEPSSKEARAERVGGLLIDAAYSGIHEDPARVKQYADRAREHCNALYMNASIDKKGSNGSGDHPEIPWMRTSGGNCFLSTRIFIANSGKNGKRN